MRNRAFGLMSIKRNPSFKTAIQERLDSIFHLPSNTDKVSVTDTLLKNDIPLARTVSFDKGKEVLDVPKGPPMRHCNFNKGREILHLHEERVKNELLVEKALNARYWEEVLEKQVEVEDVLPASGAPSVVRTSPEEETRLNSGGIHDTPPVSSSQASIVSEYHSPESASLLSAQSQAEHHSHTSQPSHISSSNSDEAHSRHRAEADHPLLGAHLRFSSTILYSPSPVMHPVTALSSVERLEEGVRSRASISSLPRPRASIDTLYDAIVSLPKALIDKRRDGWVDEGVRSKASIDTLNDAMVSLPGVSRERRSVGILHKATASLPRASIEGARDEEREAREDMVLLPRLSFEAPGGWSPIEISETGGRDEEDREGREDWEVGGDENGKDGKGGLVRRVSTCAQQ